MVAPIIAATGAVMGGIAANNQAKAEASARELQASQDADLTKQQYDLAMGEGRAQAGASGLSLLGGSNEAIFNFNSLAQGEAVSDIQFAGALDAANLKHEGKMAKIGGFLEAGSEIAGGISAAKAQKAKQDADKKSITGTSQYTTARQRSSSRGPSNRSLLKPGGVM